MFTLRRAIFFVAFVFIVGGGYAVHHYVSGQGVASQSFVEARAEGGRLAQEIVDTSRALSDNLQKVNEYDKAGDYAKALELTTELLKQSQAIRDKGVALSSQLGTMTTGLAAVKSVDAQRAALESISSRLALVSRLINYSDDLVRLLYALQDRFSGKKPAQDVATIIDQLNSEANAINNFNNSAAEAMNRFDDILKK
ncbi:MAG: hypothetical protein Q7S28_00740 [bacterium]|nr:hypothetical protein [bacterium]